MKYSVNVNGGGGGNKALVTCATVCETYLNLLKSYSFTPYPLFHIYVYVFFFSLL